MAVYLFILHSDDQAFERVERECADDKEALRTAMDLCLTCGVDVWRGERIVASIAGQHPATEKILKTQ